MLGDISKAEHIYMAVGYTDMRGNRLMVLVHLSQHSSDLIPFQIRYFYSAEEMRGNQKKRKKKSKIKNQIKHDSCQKPNKT